MATKEKKDKSKESSPPSQELQEHMNAHKAIDDYNRKKDAAEFEATDEKTQVK